MKETPPASSRVVARPTFAQLYEEHFAFAWRSARRLGTPAAEVEDVVQEIFAVAHRRLPAFEGRSSAKTWLFGIVANVVRAHRRVLGRRHPQALDGGAGQVDDGADLEALPDHSEGPEGPHDRAARREAARVVDGVLDALDDDRRAVFVLAELEQMTAPEIAVAIGIPVNTVYSRLRLAREDFAAAAARHRAREQRRNP